MKKRSVMKGWAVVALIAGLMAGPLQAEERDMTDALNEARLEGQLVATYGLNEHLSVFDISVDVEGDTAILSGTVEDSAQRELAEELALEIDGIERVDNRIEVDAEEGIPAEQDERTFRDRVTDSTLTASVKSKLFWNRDTSGLDISVTTRRGEVTLDGWVDSEESRELAEDLARGTDGVRSVNNRLRVREDAPEGEERERDFTDTVSDSWITAKARSTLAFNRDVAVTGISIETRDGVVYLTGEVSSDAEKQRAVELISGLRGVNGVEADGLEVR